MEFVTWGVSDGHELKARSLWGPVLGGRSIGTTLHLCPVVGRLVASTWSWMLDQMDHWALQFLNLSSAKPLSAQIHLGLAVQSSYHTNLLQQSHHSNILSTSARTTRREEEGKIVLFKIWNEIQSKLSRTGLWKRKPGGYNMKHLGQWPSSQITILPRCLAWGGET